MRIAHLMLFNFYYDNAFYQENILPIQNKKDGHEIKIITSTQNLVDGKRTISPPASYETKEGIEVVRLPYRLKLGRVISDKIRLYKGVYKAISIFSPDIIFVHGIGGLESKSIIRYIKEYPKTALYMDCHSDFANSATTWVSRNILHSFLYRKSFNKLVKYTKKVYFVAPESLPFLKKLYRFTDKTKLEYLPLGGYIPDNQEKEKQSDKIRKELQLTEDDILFIHSGKLDKNKKSLELIRAFTQVKSDKIRLAIVGRFTSDVYDSVKDYIDNDERITYLGWKPTEELQNYLMACDVYIQPGSRTVTVQNAACNGCALVLNRCWCYTYLFDEMVLYAETEEEIKDVLNKVCDDPSIINEQKKTVSNFAKEHLNYEVLANRYIQ